MSDCYPDECGVGGKCLAHSECYCGELGYMFIPAETGDFTIENMVCVTCEGCVGIEVPIEIDVAEDGRWIVDVVDTPGCRAYGADTKEAVVNAVRLRETVRS